MASTSYQHKPKKQLGQHFLINKKIGDFMASQIKQPTNVIEIGPGTGNLTLSLLDNPNVLQLLAIEKDNDLLPDLHLRTNHYKNKFHILHQDASTINIKEITKNYFNNQKVSLVANLPYNIGTSIVVDLMENIDHFNQIIVMLQSEVVDRLSANINSKDYGKISVLMQAQCKVEKLLKISPNNFFPKPKVFSTILSATPLTNHLTPQQYTALNKFCSVIFKQRRKTISNNLKNTAYEYMIPIIQQNFNISSRIESLTPEEIVHIASHITS